MATQFSIPEDVHKVKESFIAGPTPISLQESFDIYERISIVTIEVVKVIISLETAHRYF